LFAECQELFEGAVEGTLGGRGVALQGEEGAGGFVDQRCGKPGGGEQGVGIGRVAEADHLLDYGGLEAADAGETPARLNHFLNQELLVRGGGGEGVVVLGD
jgi:hypothetical protein